MKVTFTFDKDTRSLHLEPEDELERLVLNEMEARCSKGSQMRLSKIKRTVESNEDSFVVELKVNGH